MSLVTRKECASAIGLQSAQAVDDAVQSLFPLPDTISMVTDPHREIPEYADTNPHDSISREAGTWVDGGGRLPLIPGLVAPVIEPWCFTESATGQGQWATVWIDKSNTALKYMDVKIVSGTLTFRPTASPELQVAARGIALPTTEVVSGTMPPALEYLFKEVAITSDYDGTTLVSDETLRELTLNFDRNLQDGSDGMRIRTSVLPKHLHNLKGVSINGTIDRDFFDSTLYDAFAAGGEGKIVITAVRTGTPTYTLTITLNRVIWGTYDDAIPSAGSLVNESPPFVCLGSEDGATAPITFAETSA